MALLVVNAGVRAARAAALDKEESVLLGDSKLISPDQADWNIEPESLMGRMPTQG
jgi:hypothetical protein